MTANSILLPMEPGGGQTQGVPKRIAEVKLSLLNSYGGQVGPALGATDAIEYPAGDMDTGPELFTGIREFTFPGGYERDATIAVEGSDDFPFTLRGIFPQVGVSA